MLCGASSSADDFANPRTAHFEATYPCDRPLSLQTWADACIDDIDTVYRLGGCVYGSLAGELIEADDEVHDDLAHGYDQWLDLFHAGLTAMRQRGELRTDADPRHLAVSLVIAHQGGAMITHATGDAEPLRIAANAAVDYVRSFAVDPEPPANAAPGHLDNEANPDSSDHPLRHPGHFWVSPPIIMGHLAHLVDVDAGALS
jgi:hypothetical protein